MIDSRTIHVDLDGKEWLLTSLDSAERRLFAALKKQASLFREATGEPIECWCDFDNYWQPKVDAFYAARGLTHKRIMSTSVYQMAEDLSGRLAISLGLAGKADYRDRLIEIIQSQFKTRRAFCQATGLAEDMLSHVLAGRKDLSIEALTKALDRIGYTVQFVPRETKPSKSA